MEAAWVVSPRRSPARAGWPDRGPGPRPGARAPKRSGSRPRSPMCAAGWACSSSRLTEALQRLPVRGEATADAVPEGAGAMLARAFEPATAWPRTRPRRRSRAAFGTADAAAGEPTGASGRRTLPIYGSRCSRRGEAPAGEPRRSPDGSETERSSVFPGVAPAGAGTGSGDRGSRSGWALGCRSGWAASRSRWREPSW